MILKYFNNWLELRPETFEEAKQLDELELKGSVHRFSTVRVVQSLSLRIEQFEAKNARENKQIKPLSDKEL